MNNQKVFFFCMTVCHHRTGEHTGKRCGVVLTDTKEDAERIAWEKYGNDSTCQLWVEEVSADGYGFTIYKSEI